MRRLYPTKTLKLRSESIAKFSITGPARKTVCVICRTQMGTKFRRAAIKLHHASYEFLLSARLIIPAFLRNSYLFSAKINSKIYDVCGKKTLSASSRAGMRKMRKDLPVFRFKAPDVPASRPFLNDAVITRITLYCRNIARFFF